MDKYYVYFFPERGTEKPAIKIGYSKDPIKRLKQLQTGSSMRIGSEGWLCVGDNEQVAQAAEKSWHESFKSLRIRKNGEWFRYEDELEQIVRFSFNHRDFTRYFE